MDQVVHDVVQEGAENETIGTDFMGPILPVKINQC